VGWIVFDRTSLERRTSRGGRALMMIWQKAVAGALVTAFKEAGLRNFNRKLTYPRLAIV
jgi:hypothetical protein